MTAYTLLRDINQEGSETPRFRVGETYDFTPSVWSAICDSLGVTIQEIAVPAGQGAKETAAQIADLKAQVADLTAQLNNAKPTAKKVKA